MDDLQRAIEYLTEEIEHEGHALSPLLEGKETIRMQMFKTAVCALRELQQYRELEQRCIEENSFCLRMILQKWKEFTDDVAELYQYRQIGTVSECAGYKIHSKNISSLHDCNDCGKRNKCGFAPRLGEFCRVNCYMWEG